MISLYKISEDLFNIFILPTIIFLSFCFSFIAANINRPELNILSLVVIFIIFESAILAFYFFIKWFALSVHYLRGLSLFWAIFFLLQWYFVPFQNLMMIYTGESHRYVLFFFIFIFSVLVGFTAKNNIVYRLFLNFCLIFFVLTFSKLVFAFFTNPAKFNHPEPAIAKLPYQTHSPQPKYKNIYYFITDELGSQKGLQQAGIDTTYLLEFKNALKGVGFTILENNLSSYNVTYLSIQSIFDMGYPVDEKSSGYKNISTFYSNSLRQNNESLLEKQLKAFGYQKLIYFGNEFHNCNALRKNIICGMGVKKSFINNFLMDYTFNTFIEMSLFKSILERLGLLYGQINTLDYVSEYIQLHKKNIRPQFLFVHIIMPHPPYRTQSCERDNRYQITGLINKDLYFKLTKHMYSNSIKCLENQLIPVLESIMKQDPDAIIIVQGDHGSGFPYSVEQAKNQVSKNALNEMFSAFNAIKMPSACYNHLPASLGNVNTIRLALACAAGVNPKLLEEKHFIAYYETQHGFGKVSPYKA
ncbi:MAG: hypothetical protein A3F12_02935 [Gammaproteobacteria bacterium RIFCSPHIGHO2_12_FULL_38_14]|nr:MAG: hypothetical protein A3F12_02935 [Gammaproteobacteria bacterium RIFCSPHIGHO2_12_FULL_38_14]